MRTEEYASYRQQVQFNLSRPHSTYDHRRTCAVIGCRSKEDMFYGPLCKRHGKDPEIVKMMMRWLKKYYPTVRPYFRRSILRTFRGYLPSSS